MDTTETASQVHLGIPLQTPEELKDEIIGIIAVLILGSTKALEKWSILPSLGSRDVSIPIYDSCYHALNG